MTVFFFFWGGGEEFVYLLTYLFRLELNAGEITLLTLECNGKYFLARSYNYTSQNADRPNVCTEGCGKINRINFPTWLL